MKIADESYFWYRTAAIRSRRAHRTADITILVVSALIPLSALLIAKIVAVTAVLGAIIVILSGLRTIFPWQENYLRYSAAREAIEHERRKYLVRVEPYDDPDTRDARLAEAVTRIESEEMGRWQKIVEKRLPTAT